MRNKTDISSKKNFIIKFFTLWVPPKITRPNSVKPSNILVDYEGRIKLCDFGISGRLVDSQAQTRGAGCAAYLSPERIDPERGTYDVRADIWSLGLTLIELATAQFPYSNCKSDFEVCAKILQTEAPQLGPSFPHSMQDFVAKCCIKVFILFRQKVM